MMDADEGKKQLANVVNWVDFGFGGFEDLTTMFRKFYGLDWMPEVKDTPDYLDTWKLAMKDYAKFFHDYLGLIGLVSQDEHLALTSKYKELKKTFNSQGKEILAKDERIADQKKQMSSLKATITKLKKELENQKKIAAGQKKELSSQNRKMETQKKQLVDQKEIIAAQKKEIAVQEKAVADQQKEIAAQKKMLADQKKEITNGLAAIKQLQSTHPG
jgi:DNA repair exonuclease SbcCD ATPase subunit